MRKLRLRRIEAELPQAIGADSRLQEASAPALVYSLVCAEFVYSSASHHLSFLSLVLLYICRYYADNL